MKKTLSILIPAYNDKYFVKKIIEQNKFQIDDKLEIIIHDDSENDDISSYISNINLPKNINYYKNNQTKGAVKNWNGLLKSAKGDFLWLLHQFDMPENLQKILDEVYKGDGADIIIIPTRVEKFLFNFFKVNHLHANNGLIRIILENPKFLFMLNVIGPPSSIIARKAYYENYDDSLNWLVDVENYFRLFKRKIRFKILNNANILSIHNPNSITSNLKNLNSVSKRELKYIQSKHNIQFNLADKIYLLGLKLTHRLNTIFSIRIK